MLSLSLSSSLRSSLFASSCFLFKASFVLLPPLRLPSSPLRPLKTCLAMPSVPLLAQFLYFRQKQCLSASFSIVSALWPGSASLDPFLRFVKSSAAASPPTLGTSGEGGGIIPLPAASDVRSSTYILFLQTPSPRDLAWCSAVSLLYYLVILYFRGLLPSRQSSSTSSNNSSESIKTDELIVEASF